MKPTILTLALAALGLCAFHGAFAADTDPFDFDYTLAGDMTARPALVFNDGHDTYLQPRPGQVIKTDGGQAEGPYVVVAGTPGDIAFLVNGKTASAHWDRLNQFAGGATPLDGVRDDQPAGFSGFSNHLALIGRHGDLETVRPLTVTMPIAALIKTLVPQGWSGSAQPDVDLTGMRTFSTQADENWLHALDRLVTQLQLYASIDFTERHVRISALPPKSAAVNYAGAAASPVSTAAASDAVVAKLTAPVASSLLASAFGAEAIRDDGDTHTQIRFAKKPEPKLIVATADGTSLRPKWNDATKVLTFDRAPDFFISNADHSVEVKREEGTVYDFPVNNPAHLEGVFDKDGATYFKFAASVLQTSVTDAKHLGSGEQKGRYYRYNGMATTYTATGDGQSVSVTRRHDVRYFDRTPVIATAGAKP